MAVTTAESTRALSIDTNVDPGAAAIEVDTNVDATGSNGVQANASVGVASPIVDPGVSATLGVGPAGATADVGAGVAPGVVPEVGVGVAAEVPPPTVPVPPVPTAPTVVAVPEPTASIVSPVVPMLGGAPLASAPASGGQGVAAGTGTSTEAPAGASPAGASSAGVLPADAAAPLIDVARASQGPSTSDATTSSSGSAQESADRDGSPPPRVMAPAGVFGAMSLPTALVAALAAGIATAGAVVSMRGRPIPGLGLLSLGFAAIALSQVPDMFFGAPDSNSWRARLELALLAIPPWVIARQVHLLTRVPTWWLRVTDMSALALVASVLVVGGVPTTGVTDSGAALLTTALTLVLFVAAWISVRRMLRASQHHDPRIARVRGRTMEWTVAAFLAVYLIWLAAPIESTAFLAASVGMCILSVVLTIVAVMPRLVSDALDRVGNKAMVDSIETLVATKSLQPVLSTVMDGFADGLGVDGLAFVKDGRVIEFGGHCAMLRDRGPVVEDELLAQEGSTRLVAWPNRLAPSLGRRRRDRMQLAARLLQAAYDRDRLLAIERETIDAAAETAAALATANRTLRETNEIKGAFVSSVSHELRTPLTSIVGLARTAHDRWDDLDDDSLRDFQRIIFEQGERLTRLVNELLLIGRIEEGHVSINIVDVDLAIALEQAILDSGIDDGQIHVVLPAESTHVSTDQMLLHEVLVNYLSNAKKYGSPPIEVRFTRLGDELKVVVSDRGESIPPEFRSKLFDRFTRSRDVSGTPGTGLGLAIVREVSERLGGTAWHEQRPEGGNRFCARFKVGWSDAAAATSQLEPVVSALPEPSAVTTSQPTASERAV